MIFHTITHWHDCDRVVLVTYDFHGIIEIQYPKEAPEVGYIWHLWVDEGYRRKGYATALLDAAETHVMLQHKSKAVIEWDQRDTPKEILHWYKRKGYKETEFNRYISRLEKDIEPCG